MDRKTHKPLRMPKTLDVRPARLFPQQWAALPTHAKVLTALAVEAGLTVVHTDGMEVEEETFKGWIWGGTADQFRDSGLFMRSVNWHFQKWGSAHTGEGMDVSLLRAPDGSIIAVHRGFCGIGRRSNDRFAELARADQAFQGFWATALQPVKGLTLEAEEDPATKPPLPPATEWGAWRGDVACRITPLVSNSYRERGIFPMLATARAGVVKVSEDLARKVLADAIERQRTARHGAQANSWCQLRRALEQALRLRREGA